MFAFEYNDSDKTNYPVINAIAETYKFAFGTTSPLSLFFRTVINQPYFNEQRGQLVDETDEQGGDWIKECCEKLIFVNAIEQIKRVLVIKKEGKTEIRKKLNFLEISEATLFADNIDIICKNIVDQCMQIRI